MSDKVSSILLSSGHSMPVLGLGTWQAEDETEVEIALRNAIEAGYRHIDTAFVYFNETFIGTALKKIFSEGKIGRKDLFIVSKLPGNGHRHVEYFCKKSLAALQLDYLDLYLIHSPMSALKTEDDNEYMPIKNNKLSIDTEATPLNTWKAMEDLVDKGLTRSIGLSNFNSKQIQGILDSCRIKPANLQVECHVHFPQYKLHEFCQKKNIAFTAYSPLGSPGLPGWCKTKYGLEYELPRLLAEPELKEIADKYKKSPAQICIRYLLQRGMIVIPKSSNPERLKENLSAVDFKLEDEDMEGLKSMQTGFRYLKFEMPDGITEHPEYPFHEEF